MNTKSFGNRRWIGSICLRPALQLLNNRSRLLRYSLRVALILMPISLSAQCPFSQCFEILQQPPPSLTVAQSTNFFPLGVVYRWCSANCPSCQLLPFTHQWRRNGSAIYSATNTTVGLPAQPFVAGTLDVVITSSGCGLSWTSNPCVVRVEPLIGAINSSNGIFGFSFDGNFGKTNTVERITSLDKDGVPTWSAVWAAVGDGSTIRFSTTNSAGAQSRFYRIRIE